MRYLLVLGDYFRQVPFGEIKSSLRMQFRNVNFTGQNSDALAAQQFHRRAMTLIDGRVRVCPSAGIGIGNGDAAELRAPDDVRSLGFGDIGIEKRVVFRRITVRPAIDGNGGDVACRIEPSRRESTGELLADMAKKKSSGVAATVAGTSDYRRSLEQASIPERTAQR